MRSNWTTRKSLEPLPNGSVFSSMGHKLESIDHLDSIFTASVIVQVPFLLLLAAGGDAAGTPATGAKLIVTLVFGGIENVTGVPPGPGVPTASGVPAPCAAFGSAGTCDGVSLSAGLAAPDSDAVLPRDREPAALARLGTRFFSTTVLEFQPGGFASAGVDEDQVDRRVRACFVAGAAGSQGGIASCCMPLFTGVGTWP